ncbi:MAG TPA: hypothetical protein IAA05_05770 [Candidatus Blautia excrementipullorum]|nr:hypothetical protein [Candidatus Blautia excrementipullorum]
MQLDISTNGYKVLSSGEILSYTTDSEVSFDIAAESGFTFSIVLKFLQEANKEQKLNKNIQNNTIIFECVNFSPLGTGTISPLSLATVSGKEWFFHFWVFSTSDKGPRRVVYSILEKA